MAELEERQLLRQSIDEHRRELRLAVDELRDAARSWTPRDAVRDRPLQWLLGGLLVGLWLGWRD